MIVFGALAWSAGSLYSRGAPLPKRPLVSAGLGAICGGILLTIVSVAGGEFGEATWTWDALLAVFYLIVIGSLSVSPPTSGFCARRRSRSSPPTRT